MEGVYWIEPASPKTMWFLIPVVALLGAVIVLMVVIAYGTQRSSFELTADALRVRGDLWGRNIPLDSHVTMKVRAVGSIPERSTDP